MTKNLLNMESSPYLRQHMDNPVHWRTWGPNALHEAQCANKPILLSIGYSSCHWCHVMAKESFANQETAALMNEYFINIKVDREERPDIDAIYQRALSLMGQRGGWPLTMFLTPTSEPFWGGTYFPIQGSHNTPGFQDVLNVIHNAYTNDPQSVEKNRRNLTEALNDLATNKPGDGIKESQIALIADSLIRELDIVNGGVGKAPKFPNTPILELFWRNYTRTGSREMRSGVILTLRKISEGGIYDHLAGGYSRYSTDNYWLVPHFEKMLYDNAQILELLSLVWQDSKDPLLKKRSFETADWLITEMQTSSGAFASAIDADSGGKEGAYYLWSEKEIDNLLKADSQKFKDIYDVSKSGNFEGLNILNRLKSRSNNITFDEEILEPLRTKLLANRKKRTEPKLDYKELCDWNGQTIAALAFASAVFGESRWKIAAKQAWQYMTETLPQKRHVANSYEGKRLCHSSQSGTIQCVDFLDDYAYMARAGLLLYEVDGDTKILDTIECWFKILDEQFWDDKHGGYFFSPADGENLITRPKQAYDTATPSGNGILLGVMARLYYLTAKSLYLERAESLLKAFSGEIEVQPAQIVTFLNNAEFIENTIQIVIIGKREHWVTVSMCQVIFSLSLPNRLLNIVEPEIPLPVGHPAEKKKQLNCAPTAYVCIGKTCSAPVTDSTHLRTILTRISRNE